MLYFLYRTLVLPFYIDVILTLSVVPSEIIFDTYHVLLLQIFAIPVSHFVTFLQHSNLFLRISNDNPTPAIK